MQSWIADCGGGLIADWLPTGVLVITCLLLLELYRRHRDVSIANLPPGSSGWPIIGETLAFIIDGNKFMRERISRYGTVFRTSILGQNAIVVSGAEHVRRVLLAEGTAVLTSHPASVRALIGDGSLTGTTGAEHDLLHRFVTRTFSLDNLRLVTPAVHRIVRQFVARWRRRGNVISGVAEMKKLAFTLGANVLLGLDFGSSELETVMEIFDTYNQAFFTFPIDLPGFAYRKGKRARQELIELLRRHLKELPEKCNDKRLHLIHDLMVRHQQMNAENGDVKPTGDFINLTIELLFGSNETMASALSTILMYLGHRPDVYARVHEEITKHDVQAPSTQCTDGDLAYDDVMSARYVNYVVNEVLRIYPPIAGSFRKTIKPMRIAGYDIPVGWTILYSIPSTHQLSPLFAQKTNELIPERWQTKEEDDKRFDDEDDFGGLKLSERLKSKERFHYIPFGAGHRRCVGKQFALLCMRVFIIEVVRTGKLRLVNGFPEIRTCPFVYPKDNLPLWFEKSRQ